MELHRWAGGRARSPRRASSISLRSVQTISLTGASAGTATLTDSSGMASFTASGGSSSLRAGRFVNTVSGFGSVYANDTGSEPDVALLYAAAANSQLVSVPKGYTSLRSGGQFVEVEGFAWVYAYQTTAGGTATLYDSPGGDTFVSMPGYSSMQGSGSLVEVTGFRQVTAIASAGSLDKAWLYDGAGSNTLTAQGNQAALARAGTTVTVIGFAQVFAEGGAGSDTAQIGPTTFSLSRSGTWKLRPLI